MVPWKIFQKENNMPPEDPYYIISRSDGITLDPEALFFVLRLDFNPAARKAVLCYAEGIEQEFPDMAESIRDYVKRIEDFEKKIKH